MKAFLIVSAVMGWIALLSLLTLAFHDYSPPQEPLECEVASSGRITVTEINDGRILISIEPWEE